MADQPYYNIGTATIAAGSTSMVGQGTLWVGNARSGDVVFGRAGERNIIVNVVDNTHIDLLFPATIAQAAQGYAVMYTPDDPFTQTELRKIMKGLSASALLALSNLAPAARKGIRFDGAANAALIDISDAALSLLDDPDTSTMLSTLGVSPFVKTLLDDVDASAARSTLGLARQSSLADQTAGRLLEVGSFGLGKSLILVSPNLADVRASGTYYCNSPTGGPSGTTNGWLIVRDLDPDYASHQFIDVATGMYWENLRYAGAWRGWRRQMNEFGTNGNGSYLRFPDGTQMCWGTISTGVSANTQFTDTGQMPWAAAFSAIPRFFASALGNYGNQVLVASPIGTTASNYSVRMINAFAANNTAGTATAVALAIGRWF